MPTISTLNASVLSGTQSVTQAIKQASARSGVDFSYLMNKASTESSLNPTAKAKGSTATGLFQFVEQTWLRVVKEYGPKYGMSAAADKITIGTDGVARVNDTSSKQAILALRKDPTLSASMAAELTNKNKETLQTQVGGNIGPTDLYMAHFLGANGATHFLNAMHDNPNAKAADVLPTAAAANPAVFYTKSGHPRSLGEIYQHFAKKFEATPATTPSLPTTTVASAAPVPTQSSSVLSILSGTAPVSSSSTGTSVVAMNTTKPDPTLSSPFATMMLAQMDLGDMSSSAPTTFSKTAEDQRKHDVASMLGLAA